MLLLTAIFLSLFHYSSAQFIKPYGHVKVDKHTKPYFDRFVKLLEENDLEIDWSKVQHIETIPLLQGIQGLYSNHSSTVILSYYMYFPKNATEEEKKDLVFLTLAHEIGHSQGWEHIEEDAIGLMNPYNKYDYNIVKGSIGAEQYILNTYKARLSKK